MKAKKILSSFVEVMKLIPELFGKAPIRFTLISAFIMELLIETFCRHSLIKAAVFVGTHPLMFLTCVAIILLTYSFSWIMKKGFIMWLTATVVWLGLGIANGIVLLYRAAPLTGSDVAILGDVLPIIGVYLNIFQIILISIAILGAIAGLVLLWIKFPAREFEKKPQLIKFGGFTASFAVLTVILAVTSVFPRNFSDLNKAYMDYGFPYGLTSSIFVQGISEPDDYGSEVVDSILDRIEAEKQQSGKQEKDKRPNVIYVQLESFLDVNLMTNITLKEDPVPNFTALKEKYPHGYLSVPLVGAGTANSEFEILTGMNLDYFGAGEYPYTTVLDKGTCESVAYAFGNYGYKTHAMHNNTGSFYLRDVVYANLGFDTFTPIENMYGVEYNALDWAKDSCLFPQIKETLLSTSERDFIFTVSVQAHGKYPEIPVGDDYSISEDELIGDLDEETKNMYLFYLNQLKGTDEMIGDLVAWIEDFEEPTVIVFYGDHLPYLEITEDMLANGDLYQTEYILYSNYDMGETVAKDIEAYQLNALVFDSIGMEGGIMCDAHTYLSDEEDYLDILQELEYDMLFGEKYAYGERGEYKRKDMKFGIRTVTVTGVTYIQTGELGERYILTVTGTNFNKFSTVFINGEEEGETWFVSETVLKVTLKNFAPDDDVTVVQLAEDGTEFGSSNEFTVN